MDETDQVGPLIAETLAGMGYELVRVRLVGHSPRRLEVMVERSDGTGVSVEECVDLTPALSAALDAHDPIPGSYHLEVSSPGIDRPLTRATDFDRWAGYTAKLELGEPVAGQKRYKATLLGRDADGAVLIDALNSAGSQGRVTLPFETITRAKLVLTDALMQAGEGSQRRN